MRYEENIGDPWRMCPCAKLVDGDHVCQNPDTGKILGNILDSCAEPGWHHNCSQARKVARSMKIPGSENW